MALIPNIGAEEGPQWPALLEKPAVAATVALWRHLFPAPHHLIGTADTTECWPESMGDRPQEAAFAWLEGRSVASWWGDPRAVDLARENGLEWPEADAETILRVHDKAFAVRMSQELGLVPTELDDLGFVLEAGELTASDDWIDRVEREIGTWPAFTGGRFCLKPRLGSSGRGRVSGQADDLDRVVLQGAARSLARRGGAILEPWLARSGDFSVQLHIGDTDPAVTVLGGLRLWVTNTGLYRGHLGEVDSRGRVFSGDPEEERARTAAAMLASEAQALGFRGPCGVDGLSFEIPGRADEEPTRVIRPAVEFNARFTLGTIVIGLIRRNLKRLQTELELSPGQRRAFLFALDTPPGWTSWEALAESLPGRVLGLPLAALSAPARPGLVFADSLTELEDSLLAKT